MPEVATCPIHGEALRPRPSKYGTRWFCPVLDCDVIWWNAPNTSPADYDTRQARKAAHNTFDALWKSGTMTRGEAYEWLQQTFELAPDKAHIGLFTKQQCEDLCYAVRRWLGKDRRKGD